MPWPTPRDSPPVPPGASYPDVPALVVAGQLDSTTTPFAAEATAMRFPKATFVNVAFGTHASALFQSALGLPDGICARDLMRSFLENPRYPIEDPGCSAESYRALGNFPLIVAEVPPATDTTLGAPERLLVAAAFNTAADAVARRNLWAWMLAGVPSEPGLRGGEVSFDDANRAFNLTDVHFVEDLAVTGEIQLDEADVATAVLQVTDDDGTIDDVELLFQAFVAEDATRVTGTLNGSAFEASVPLP